MSGTEDKADKACASCGIKGGEDGGKLKRCSACKLVLCSSACQKEHWSHHKQACKKRASELRDELLFKQPESSHLGDCPVCCLPLPLDESKSNLYVCCSKIVCNGCRYRHQKRSEEELLESKCPSCDTPTPRNYADFYKCIEERAKASDPIAICEMGKMHKEHNFSSALKLWAKAAELGDAQAHFHIAKLHSNGQGTKKDIKKAVKHWEAAAISGHPAARYNLAAAEGKGGRIERAVKHLTIAAKMGHGISMEKLKELYVDGDVKKEDLAIALRAHEAAACSTKSPYRVLADLYYHM